MEWDLAAKGGSGDEYQLASYVAAIKVRRGVSLGQSAGLRLGNGVIEGDSTREFVQDEIGGAIEHSLDRNNAALARKALDRFQIRNRAAHRGRAQQLHSMAGSQFIKARMARQSDFVGGHNVLA